MNIHNNNVLLMAGSFPCYVVVFSMSPDRFFSGVYCVSYENCLPAHLKFLLALFLDFQLLTLSFCISFLDLGTVVESVFIFISFDFAAKVTF